MPASIGPCCFPSSPGDWRIPRSGFIARFVHRIAPRAGKMPRRCCNPTFCSGSMPWSTVTRAANPRPAQICGTGRTSSGSGESETSRLAADSSSSSFIPLVHWHRSGLSEQCCGLVSRYRGEIFQQEGVRAAGAQADLPAREHADIQACRHARRHLRSALFSGRCLQTREGVVGACTGVQALGSQSGAGEGLGLALEQPIRRKPTVPGLAQDRLRRSRAELESGSVGAGRRAPAAGRPAGGARPSGIGLKRGSGFRQRLYRRDSRIPLLRSRPRLSAKLTRSNSFPLARDTIGPSPWPVRISP